MEFMEFGPFTFWGCPALQGRERKRESASIAGERERERECVRECEINDKKSMNWQPLGWEKVRGRVREGQREKVV